MSEALAIFCTFWAGWMLATAVLLWLDGTPMRHLWFLATVGVANAIAGIGTLAGAGS